jgi:branched-chain amino acid transport system permease protein
MAMHDSQPRSLALVLAIGLAGLAIFPIFGADEKFYMQFLAKIMVMAIFAMSLDLLIGYGGLVSLGHAMYFGLAGYTLMLLTPDYQGASLWISLAAALGVCALAALVVGVLVLRTSGIYFIMVTLAFAQMAYYVVHDSSHLGGSDGKYIYVKPVLSLFGWRTVSLDSLAVFYYVILVALVGVYFLMRGLLASPFGHVLVGIKANEQRMNSLGFATFRYKLVAFVIAGMLAGLAGYLAAALDGLVNPELLSWHQSGQALMMVIFGGMGTPAGPILGAGALKLLELQLTSWTKHWQLLLGLFIVLVVLVFPNGLASLFGKRKRDGGGHG